MKPGDDMPLLVLWMRCEWDKEVKCQIGWKLYEVLFQGDGNLKVMKHQVYVDCGSRYTVMDKNSTIRAKCFKTIGFNNTL